MIWINGHSLNLIFQFFTLKNLILFIFCWFFAQFSSIFPNFFLNISENCPPEQNGAQKEVNTNSLLFSLLLPMKRIDFFLILIFVNVPMIWMVWFFFLAILCVYHIRLIDIDPLYFQEQKKNKYKLYQKYPLIWMPVLVHTNHKCSSIHPHTHTVTNNKVCDKLLLN